MESLGSAANNLGKISAQPHPTLCIQLLNRGNNDKNNTFPLGKQICFTIVWGCAETLPQFVYITRSNVQRIECFIREFTALAETKARKMKRFQIFLHKQPQINKQALIDTCWCINR